jgi:hypothetical protein
VTKKWLKEMNIYSNYKMTQREIRLISNKLKSKILDDREERPTKYTDEKLRRMIKRRIDYLATQGFNVWYGEHGWHVAGSCSYRTDEINDIIYDLKFIQHTIE